MHMDDEGGSNRAHNPWKVSTETKCRQITKAQTLRPNNTAYISTRLSTLLKPYRWKYPIRRRSSRSTGKRHRIPLQLLLSLLKEHGPRRGTICDTMSCEDIYVRSHMGVHLAEIPNGRKVLAMWIQAAHDGAVSRIQDQVQSMLHKAAPCQWRNWSKYSQRSR
jgi:hypothetical protein